MGKDNVRYHYGKKHPYLSLYHENSGVYVRTGLREDGTGTDQDPFLADFPEILHIGITGRCIHRRQESRTSGSDGCRNAAEHLERYQTPMSFKDFQTIIRACEGKTYQITLQGLEDPDQHPDFADMAAYSRRYGIVPNIITSGLGITAELAAVCKTFCGTAAVHGTCRGTAVVWHRKSASQRAVDLLLQAGVRTDLHYVLSAATIGEAVRLLETNGFPDGIHTVFFQLYKPTEYENNKKEILTADTPLLKEFFRLAAKEAFPFQVRFEPCMVPGALCHTRHIEPERLDACEGGRWSAYLTPDLYLLPCRFAGGDLRYAVSLKDHTMQEAWESKPFDRFRSLLKTACPDCTKRENCMGGCPVCPEIVLCDQKPGRKHI